MKLAIAVLGTGRMGSALARALLGAGHEVTVWNRTPAKTGPLAALGAVVAHSVAKAVAAGAVVIVNVSDYDATTALLREASVARALDGKLVRDLPPSALDKLHPQSHTQRAQAYKPITRTVAPAKRVVNGQTSMLVRVRAAN